MRILVTSPDGIAPAGEPIPELVEILKAAKTCGDPVALLSNHKKPDWFDAAFDGSGVQFLTVAGRQNGEILQLNAQNYNLESHDVVVLAGNEADLHMGKNAGAVVVAADWASDARVKGFGIKVYSPPMFREVIDLTRGWDGGWYFEGEYGTLSVRALTNLSSYGAGMDQVRFSKRLTDIVKTGAGNLTAMLVVTARSLLREGVSSDAAFGVYPSSSVTTGDVEVLSEFTHSLRTTVSRVRFAKTGEPLLLRHRQSTKRHLDKSADRTDATGQMESVCVNPYYQGRLNGRHVYLIDDCTTYGLSFAVAHALLIKAGAAGVTGIAIGKFGNQLKRYDIQIAKDASPFSPLGSGQYSSVELGNMKGQTSAPLQTALRALL